VQASNIHYNELSFFFVVPEAEVYEALRKLTTRGQIHFLHICGLCKFCTGKFVIWSPLDFVPGKKKLMRFCLKGKASSPIKCNTFFLSRLKRRPEENIWFLFLVFLQLNVRQNQAVRNSSLTFRVDKHGVVVITY